jgi:hypothetical protein
MAPEKKNRNPQRKETKKNGTKIDQVKSAQDA